MRKQQFRVVCSFVLIAIAVVSCDNKGLAPLREGISGRITYTGTWPDTTEWVRLAVFKKIPPSAVDIILNPPAFSDTLPRFVGSYDYDFILPAGTYEWVVLAWKPIKPNASNDFSGLDTLGMYSPIGQPWQPRTVVVSADQMVEGIGIIADFEVPTPPSPILP